MMNDDKRMIPRIHGVGYLGLSQDNKKGVEKEKWVNDRKSKKKHITPKSEAQQLALESFE